MNSKLTLIKILNQGELEEYFSSTGVIYEMLNLLSNGEVEFNYEMHKIVEIKVIDLIKEELIEKFDTIIVFKKDLFLESPEIWETLLVFFEVSQSYDEFKEKLNDFISELAISLQRNLFY